MKLFVLYMKVEIPRARQHSPQRKSFLIISSFSPTHLNTRLTVQDASFTIIRQHTIERVVIVGEMITSIRERERERERVVHLDV